MGERAPVSTEETLVRYDNPVLVTKQPEKVVSLSHFLSILRVRTKVLEWRPAWKS